MHSSSSLSQKIKTYLTEMFHFDPDNMQMGAKAICQLVVSGQLKLQQNQQIANKIRQAFIKQMQLDNYNVHAHAIKCIAQMVPKLPSEQIQKIFEKIIKSIADKNLDQKKRQIYGICAGTVIHQAEQQYGEKLSDLFVESIKQLMISKDQKNQIQVILINVISQFIRKWPRISYNSKNKFNVDDLVSYLLKNIQLKNKLEIVKKSQNALGKVSSIIDRNNLEILFNHAQFGLLNYISHNKPHFTPQSMKKLRNGLLCLVNILKTHNNEIKHWSYKITNILIQIISKYKNYDNIDQIDLTCDILDCSIVCLYYLIKSYSKQLQSLLNSNKQQLNIFVEELLNFNLEGQMEYVNLEDQNMKSNCYQDNQYQDYYQQQHNNDQKGWKVRRATLNYISILIKKNKIFKQKLYSSQNQLLQSIVSKIIQTNSMVSQMSLNTINQIIKSFIQLKNYNNDNLFLDDQNQIKHHSIILNNQQIQSIFVINKILEEMIKKINIIFKSTKFNDQIKIQTIKILFKLIKILKSNKLDQSLSQQLRQCFIDELKNSKIIQCKYYSLLCLKQLIRKEKGLSKYEQIIKQALKILNNNNNITNQNIKILTSCYKYITQILQTFPQQLSHSSLIYFNQILNIIKTKLKQHDSDKLIKQQLIKCITSIFNHYLPYLNQQDQNQIIKTLNIKLNIQIQKCYLLNVFDKIDNQYEVKKQNINIYKQTLVLVSNWLGSTNVELNNKVVNVVKKLIVILRDGLDHKTVSYILTKSKTIFNQYKNPSFIQILIKKFPSQIKQYAEAIIKTTELNVIMLLWNQKIVTYNQIISVLKTIQRQDSIKNINLILANIGANQNDLKAQINQSKWGIICLGTLGYCGTLNSLQLLINILLSPTNQQFKLQAASALGNITSRHQQQLIDIIISTAQKSKNLYVFIYTIRQYLIFKINNNQNVGLLNSKLTQWLFKKSQQNFEGQSIYHLISECVGKIAYISNNQTKLIQSLVNSPIENHRFIIANSLKFYFEGRNKTMQDQNITEFLSYVMKLIGDKSVNVRTSIMKSLNSIAFQNFNLIQNFMNQQFWKCLKNNLTFDQSLIIQVDYGISKEKKDLGRALRLQSLNFLKFILKNQKINSYLINELILISLTHLNKQTNPDLIIKKLSVVRNLCQIQFIQFITHIPLFIQKISIQEGILKPYQKKVIIQDQRNDVYLNTIISQIVQINKISEKQNFDQVSSYIITLKNNQRFRPIFEKQQLINIQND